MKKKIETYGLALEGGGAKGAFHMGAVKALREQGYQFGAVAGTSIGALNGAVIAQGDFELGCEWWQKMDTSMLFDIEKAQAEKYSNRQLSRSMLKSLIRLAREMLKSRGLDTSKIRKMLGEIIDEDKVRKSGVDFGLVTVSLSDLKPLELYLEDIPQGRLIDYLMASAYLPAFKQEPLDGKYFLDGAFYDNCPINMLGRKGYKNIIAVRTLGIGRKRKIEGGLNVLNIVPSKDLGNVLVFDNGTISQNIKMGYCDAMRTLKNLRGKTYYIDAKIDDSLVLERLAKLPEEDIAALAQNNIFRKLPPKRMLLERILPKLAGLAGLSADAQYIDIIIGVLEKEAECLNVEKYEVYSLEELVGEIRKAKQVGTAEPAPALAMRKQRRSKLVSTAADIILDNI